MSLLTSPVFTALDSSGMPISGALLYFYQSGTTTPMNTYTDATYTIPHANPVEANAAGRFPPIYLLSADYKAELRDADDVVIQTIDPILAPLSLIDEKTTESFTGDGTTADFTLSREPASDESLDIYIDGLHTTGWTRSEADITFGTSPALDAVVTVRFANSISPSDIATVATKTTNDANAALAARAAAEAAAATVNLPDVTGQAGNSLFVTEEEDGYEHGRALRPDVTAHLTAGYTAAVHVIGNSGTGTITPTIADGSLQSLVATGSFTLAAPSDSAQGWFRLDLAVDATGGYSVDVTGYDRVLGILDMTANVKNRLLIEKTDTETCMEVLPNE